MPTVVDAGGGGAVEVGVEFTASVNGTISGIRFYKSATNTGVHVGNLWSIGGSLLASATFTGETASGWQTVTFSSPVAITAGMVYVASYHTNGSHFSADLNYFATAGVNNPPLQALSNGVNGGNGVYVYSSASTFPNNTYESTNYWVDVVFTPAPTAILESIEVAANNLTVNVGATQQFTATGTYEDNSTQDITAQVTWSSSNTTDATINTTGLATGLAVGSSQISATLNSVSGDSVGLTVQLPVCPCIPSATVLATPINGHTAYGDVNNGDGLLSWINPNGGNSFDTYMSSIVAWTDNSLPACGGEPGYYYYSFEPCSDYLIPPADQAAMMIGAALVWQHYASNDNMISAAVTWATYVMNNGSSSEWAWPNLPCAASRPGGGSPPYDGNEPVINGIAHEYTLEPSKIGTLGYQFCKLYEYDDSTYASYLTTAEAYADALVSMRNTSANGTASPWPFRIDAEYGTIYEAFTGDVVTELRLFDELITLGAPNSPNYTVARNAARAWMLTYVVGAPTNAHNYYEDFGSDPANYNNYILGETASYLLDNPGIDSSYLADAEKLISFEETQLVFNFLGLANGPGEQIDYNYPTPDAASRYALVCAKIAKAGGGVTYYNKAFWAFNLVTYFMVAISGSTAGQVSTAILPSLAITSINNPNGGLVTINTAAPTGFGSDSLNPNAVVISGVSGQTSINGTWGISIVSPTSFTLDGAIGNGVSSNDGYESYVMPNAWWRVSWETIIHMTQAISLYPAWGVTN